MAQTEAESLELLLEVGRLLSSKLDLGDLLRSVLELSSRVVGAESASLLLLDEKKQELYFDVALGMGDEASKTRLALGQGIAGSVAKTLAPAIINDVKADERWSPQMDAASGFVTRSILAVPMTIKGHLVGVIEAINKTDGGFTDQDLRIFEAFASQAAVAIDNARLFSSLKEERFKLNTVFTEMTDGAILADAKGAIVLANPTALKYVGEAATLEAALQTMVITPSLQDIFSCAQGTVEFSASRESPKKLVLAGRATRIKLGWLLIFRDETESWQKERIKRTFLSLISHKLKTPLAAVTGFSEILLLEFRERPPQSPMMLKAVTSISSQGRKLADLVDKLLRYTTLENPDSTIELKPVPLDQVVGETLRAMKEWLSERGAQVLQEDGKPVMVVGDRLQLCEVVKNLVENAVKFDVKPGPKVAVWVETLGSEAVLRVRDSGPGIPPEDQEKVFSRFHQIETFFTGQVEGWGLGLPYVKKVVQGHGGKLELKSVLGEGTTVTVRLPVNGALGKGVL